MLGVDSDVVRWKGSFMSKRKVSLVVDRHQYETVKVET